MPTSFKAVKYVSVLCPHCGGKIGGITKEAQKKYQESGVLICCPKCQRRKHYPCRFETAWVGFCKKESLKKFCPEHRNMVCGQCGKQANHTCDHTGSLVCGEPLCESHSCNHGR